MSSLAPTLQAFFTDRLLCQRRVSPNTIASYRDTFRLLLSFAQQQTGKPPARLELSDLDATLIGAFLEQLESERGNSTRTRNIRLAAVRSFFHYAALRHPEHASVIQRVLAIPAKRSDQRIVTFLTPEELKALLASPDQTTWAGRRDHALLLTAAQTGLRVSEVNGLTRGDLQLGTGAHLPTVPLPRRWDPHPRRDRTPTRETRRRRSAQLSDPTEQARDHARPAAHRGDDAAHRRHRHGDDRAVARTRARAHHARLSPR
jgi:integrase